MEIALIQFAIKWESPLLNTKFISQQLKKLDPHVRLVILPEAFTTGFSINYNNIDKWANFPVLEWMQNKAASIDKTIAGSVFVKENGKYYNRFYWVEPNGIVHHYDKRHLFTHGGEDRIFSPGNRRVIVEKEGLKFNLQICYDLRFPVWSANRYHKTTKQYEYDILVYVANWPAIRKEAYLPLLRARAIENQAYVIWVNRVGRDGRKILHSGDTRIIHPSGRVIKTIKSNNEGILTYRLDKAELDSFRKDFPIGPDWDEFDIK